MMVGIGDNGGDAGAVRGVDADGIGRTVYNSGTPSLGADELMDKKVIVPRVLDRAVAKAVESEFARLTDGMSPVEKRGWISKSSESLELLRTLDSPDYSDNMVALLYIVRYQLSHINLAYSIIKSMEEQAGSGNSTLTDTGRLHVADFGCGSLAMQFGVALAVADALEQGQVISEVWIDSIDTSKPMIDMGRRVWTEFRDIVSQDVRLESLKTSCGLIDKHFKAHTDCHSVRKMPDADSWVSAMHVVYKSNRQDVKRALAILHKSIGPGTGFITCYGGPENPGNIPVVNQVSPFGKKYRLFQLSSSHIASQFHRILANSHIARAARGWGFFAPNWYHIYCDWPDRTTVFIYSKKGRGDVEQPSPVFDFLRKFFRMFAINGRS